MSKGGCTGINTTSLQHIAISRCDRIHHPLNEFSLSVNPEVLKVATIMAHEKSSDSSAKFYQCAMSAGYLEVHL